MNIDLKERIAGLLYGFAVGDALGLGTEFMTRRIVEKKYPDGLTDYSQIVRDGHRSQWQRGEWSNDTNYVLMLVESILEKETIDHLDYARRLSDFVKTNPGDINTHLRWVISQPDFVDNPFQVARRVWIDMKDEDSPSDNLGRALIIGLWNENVAHNAVENCRLTHPKPRCETSAVVIALMVNSLLWKNEEIPSEMIQEIVKKINIEPHDYLETAHNGKLEDFNLDDPDTCLYVRKTMGAALWTLWHCDDPNEALVKIVREGGDANINAALALSLLGLKFGKSAIDKKYIDNLIGAERIEAAAERLTALLQKKFVND